MFILFVIYSNKISEFLCIPFYFQTNLFVISFQVSKYLSFSFIVIQNENCPFLFSKIRVSFILRFKFFVYSAYFDDRVGGAGSPTGKTQGMVRIISATKTKGPERVWCRFWYRPENGGNVTASVTVAAKVKVR